MTNEEPTTVEEAPHKPSGAQQRKDTRERILKGGVWCLPRPEQGEKVQRGKPR